VPLTPANSRLNDLLTFRTNGEVDLANSLSKFREVYLDKIRYSRNQVTPTPKAELMSVLSQSEAGLVDLMGSTYYGYARGTWKVSMPIFSCIFAAVQFVASCRQDLQRFDNMMAYPKIPRVAGEVFRGISDVSREKLEKWLTIAARGEPLYLGLENAQSAVFASRIPGIATDYMGPTCERRNIPDTYDVLYVINQKGGVSIETILSRDAVLKPVVISKDQKFKVVEIFKTNDRRRLVIKLEEM
jgi:hypothetical protein